MTYLHTVSEGCKKLPPVPRHGLPALALFLLFLSGLLKPALAQTEVCGSTCSAWAATTSPGAAPASAFLGNQWLAWKGHSSNYIYFTYGPPGTSSWTNQAKVSGVSASGSTWYAETNVSPALTQYEASYGAEFFLAWKGQSDSSI